MAKKYYSKNLSFHPLLILSNIGCLLSINYISNIIFTLLFNLLFGVVFHKSQIIGYEHWDFISNYSYVTLVVVIIESLVMILSYITFVEKANKIVDYALTNYLLSIMIIWVCEEFPLSFTFWLISSIKIVVTILIAEYVSLKIESRDIKINFLGGNI